MRLMTPVEAPAIRGSLTIQSLDHSFLKEQLLEEQLESEAVRDMMAERVTTMLSQTPAQSPKPSPRTDHVHSKWPMQQNLTIERLDAASLSICHPQGDVNAVGILKIEFLSDDMPTRRHYRIYSSRHPRDVTNSLNDRLSAPRSTKLPSAIFTD